MTNFKLSREDFRYQDAERGDVIRLEVSYDIGGNKTRGLYVVVTSINIKENERGFISESFALFSAGFRVFIEPLKRKNPKALAGLAEKLDPLAPEIVALFKVDRDAAKQKIKDICGCVVGGAR